MDKFLQDDFFHFFCSEQIGKGADRDVYTFSYDPTLVVKIDIGGRFANCKEWDVWTHFSKQRPDIAKFLAPCYSISSCGRVLLQYRTQPLDKEISLDIPSFMWDNRSCNWGLLNGNIVCHDYSNHTLYLDADKVLIHTKIQ